MRSHWPFYTLVCCDAIANRPDMHIRKSRRRTRVGDADTVCAPAAPWRQSFGLGGQATGLLEDLLRTERECDMQSRSALHVASAYLAHAPIRVARQTLDRSLCVTATTLHRLYHRRSVRAQTALAHPADHPASNTESRSRDSRTRYSLGGVGYEWKSRFADWRAGAIVTRKRHSVAQLALSFVPRLLAPQLDRLSADNRQTRIVPPLRRMFI